MYMIVTRCRCLCNTCMLWVVVITFHCNRSVFQPSFFPVPSTLDLGYWVKPTSVHQNVPSIACECLDANTGFLAFL